MMTKFTGVGVGDGDGDAVTDPRGVGETTGGVGVGVVFVELLLQPPVAVCAGRKGMTYRESSANFQNAGGSADRRLGSCRDRGRLRWRR